MDPVLQLAISVPVAAAIAALAWLARALDPAGALAAGIVGAIVFGLAGPGAALVLVFFFVSSSALTRLTDGGERGRRGVRQVAANGSAAAAAAALFPFHDAAGLAFLGALGAATADTWATEVGVRFGGIPRSILTLRPRTPGTSGAVSAWGTAAAATGAIGVAAVGVGLTYVLTAHSLPVAAAGFCGAILDSLLGDSLQARYHCRECGERPGIARHAGCPVRAHRVGGVPGLDNDVVNGVTTWGAAGLAVILRYLLD